MYYLKLDKKCLLYFIPFTLVIYKTTHIYAGSPVSFEHLKIHTAVL